MRVAFLVSQMVKNPPAMQETPVQSLSQEDPLEKGLAIYSSVLAWGIPWMTGGLQFMGGSEVGHDRAINTFTFRHEGDTSDTQGYV